MPIDTSFNETLKQSNLSGLAGEITESFIDAVLNEGVLKELPIIGSILGINKAILTIKDRLFLKKVLTFLSGIKHIDKEKRLKIISEINEDKDQKIKVGDKLIYILDKCDDHIMAMYFAQLFCIFLDQKIDYNEFVRGSKIIQNIYLKDLEYFLSAPFKYFERNDNPEESPHEEDFTFINLGLIGFGSENIYLEKSSSSEDPHEYYLKGGRVSIYLTTIGRKIKDHLKIL